MYVVTYKRSLFGHNFVNDVVLLEPPTSLRADYETFEDAKSALHSQMNEMNPYEAPTTMFTYAIDSGEMHGDRVLLISTSFFKEPYEGMEVEGNPVIEIGRAHV